MARPILMPQVGQDLTEGKVTAIHVKPGDKVKKGDIVAEVESEKAVFEVEAFETGTILEVRYGVGDTAIVLKPLMMVGDEGEKLETQAPAAGFSGEDAQTIAAAAKEPAASASAAAQPETAAPKAGSGRSSPLARRLAAANGIDIASVPGSGPRGAVVKRDVEAFRRDNPGRQSSVLAFAAARSPAASGSAVLKTLQSGSGDPVLFIHGFGSELSSWRPLLQHLAIANPVLAVDLPGHGGAAGSSAGGFDDLVATVRGALAAEGIARLHLAGHSLGAAVAAAIAGDGDLDVRSLSLMAPAGLGPKINGDFIAGFLSSTTPAALRVWLELLVHDAAKLPNVLVTATLGGRDGTTMVENQARLAASVFSGNTQLFSVRAALDRFAGPVRIVVGADDRIIPSEQAYAAPAHVALHRLPQVGHLPQLEAAALVGRLVSQTVRSAG